MGRDAFGYALIISLIIDPAFAVEQNLALSDASNFLDAGLTALGLLTALVTTVMRGRLDAENNTRDLLTFFAGKKVGSVTTLGGNCQEHSSSKALLIVEEKSVVWAREVYCYYGAVSGKSVDLMQARWLHPDNYPTQDVERCKCPGGLRCKCLLLQRVPGVTEHLVAIAKGAVFKLNDEFDAIISTSCRHHKCHGSHEAVYQGLHPGGIAGPLGPAGSRTPGEEALLRSVSDLYVDEEGNTGLIMLDPAEEASVRWGSTLLEASVTKDSDERGSENPFTDSYKTALEGEEQPTGTGREEFSDAPWWLSRAGGFLIAATLVILFRTDAFSSVLLARRALRGYTVDKTGTKLPLEVFCKLAQCQGVPGERKAFVVLKPKKNLLLKYPHRALWLATALEAVVVFLWIAAVAATTVFHPVGSSYVGDGSEWAITLGAIVVLLASSFNAWWWYKQASEKRRWALVASLCGIVDLGVVAVAVVLMVQGAKRHWIVTTFRVLMLLGALMQWMLGVQHLGPLSSSFRGRATIRVLPYALTYLRLLALVAGAGSWA